MMWQFLLRRSLSGISHWQRSVAGENYDRSRLGGEHVVAENTSEQIGTFWLVLGAEDDDAWSALDAERAAGSEMV